MKFVTKLPREQTIYDKERIVRHLARLIFVVFPSVNHNSVSITKLVSFFNFEIFALSIIIFFFFFLEYLLQKKYLSLYFSILTNSIEK